MDIISWILVWLDWTEKLIWRYWKPCCRRKSRFKRFHRHPCETWLYSFVEKGRMRIALSRMKPHVEILNRIVWRKLPEKKRYTWQRTHLNPVNGEETFEYLVMPETWEMVPWEILICYNQGLAGNYSTIPGQERKDIHSTEHIKPCKCWGNFWIKGIMSETWI